MEEIQKLNEALLIVERYSDYLARKAWGKTLIIWGILTPIGLVLYFNRQSLSTLLEISIELLTLLISALVVLIGIGFTIYNFVSASRMLKTQKDQGIKSPKESSLHGIIICFVWFLSFTIVTFLPEPFTVISTVWAAGFAILISFLILKKYHDTFPELIVVGVILLISSIPLAVIVQTDVELARIATVIIYSISFLIGGLYSFTIATDILSRNR
ncbi:MAG: hypothetical protein ACFFFH_21110 [Candidatus Thorarchaeota archaeon]